MENARTHISVFCEYRVGLEYLITGHTVDFWVYLPSATTFGPKNGTQDEIKIILKGHIFMQFQSAYLIYSTNTLSRKKGHIVSPLDLDYFENSLRCTMLNNEMTR